MSSLNSTIHKNNKKNLVEILFTRFVIVFLVVVGFNNSAVSLDIDISQSKKIEIKRFSCNGDFSSSHIFYGLEDDKNFISESFEVCKQAIPSTILSSCVDKFYSPPDNLGSRYLFYAYTRCKSGNYFYGMGLDFVRSCSGSSPGDECIAACNSNGGEWKNNGCYLTPKGMCESGGGYWDNEKNECNICGYNRVYDANTGSCVNDCSKAHDSSDSVLSENGRCVSPTCKAKADKQRNVTKDYHYKNWNQLYDVDIYVKPTDEYGIKILTHLDEDGCVSACEFIENNDKGGKYACVYSRKGLTLASEIQFTSGTDPECSGDNPSPDCIELDRDSGKITTDENPESGSSGSNPTPNPNFNADDSDIKQNSSDSKPIEVSSGGSAIPPNYQNTGSESGTTGGGGSTTGGGGSGSGTGSGTGSGSGSGTGDGDGDGKGDGDGDGETVDGDFDGEFGNPEKTDIPEASFDIFELFEKYRKDYFKFSRSCPTSVQIDIFGQSKTISIEILCKFGDFLRLILHITAYIILLKLIAGSANLYKSS